MSRDPSQTSEVIAEPAPNEVRAELERVLASPAFEQAGRASQFLRFVVEETLAGRRERLKGYTIAVAVFERPVDFDAQADPVVRVEAGRLRRRLTEYYLAEGRENPVRIGLPRGGYAPVFAYAVSSPHGAQGARPARTQRRVARGAVAAAAALPLAAIAVWLIWSSQPEHALSVTESPEAVAAARARPRLVVLPLADLSGDPDVARFTRGLSEEIIRAFVDLDIVAVASPAGSTLEPASLPVLREQFDAGYALTGSAQAIGGSVRMAARLIETGAGTQLWAQTFDEPVDGHNWVAVQERLGLALATIIASPYGPIYAHAIERIAERPTASLSPFECVLRFYGYVQTLARADHADALVCLERSVREAPESAAAWSSLATLYLHEHSYGINPKPDAAPAIERALEAARRSLDLDGSGRAVAVTLIGVRHASGDLAGFERAVERALAIRPPHPAISGHVGFLLTLSGDWQRGIPMLDAALPMTVNPPSWMLTAYAFRSLETKHYADALDWALRVDMPNWFADPMTTAAAAALADRPDIAERELARLLELYPRFASEGAAQLERWGMNDALAATVLEGLRRAGLAAPSGNYNEPPR